MQIDMVVAYVDNQDKVWRKTYFDYVNKRNIWHIADNISGGRFKDIGLINYQLKLIEKNMPFVNKIYLLVSNIEQVPLGINKNKVIPVLHKDFIPVEYLPTFNSTTIEMFLWNIPNLSEYFIYANDDMIPVGKMEESDFFTKEGKIKISFLHDTLVRNDSNFKYQCLNSYLHVMDKLFKKTENNLDFIRPIHSFTPIIKSHAQECYLSLSSYINKYVWAFRTKYQHNQYIYPIWEHEKYGTLESTIDFMYTEEAKEEDFHYQILCINRVKTKENGDLIISELNNLLNN